MARGFTPIHDKLGWSEAGNVPGDIVQINFGWRTAWRLVAEYEHEGGNRWITVEDPVSYRVHDESELIPYWEQIKSEGASRSFAYEITESGYLTELGAGVSGLTERPMRHILITGMNICLEVIASDLPVVSSQAPKPVESVEAWEQIRAERTSSAWAVQRSASDPGD